MPSDPYHQAIRHGRQVELLKRTCQYGPGHQPKATEMFRSGQSRDRTGDTRIFRNVHAASAPSTIIPSRLPHNLRVGAGFPPSSTIPAVVHPIGYSLDTESF